MRTITIFLMLLVGSICSQELLAQHRSMQIDGGDKVEMLIIDPLGRKSGYDPITNTIYTEIPDTYVGAGGIDTHTDSGVEEDPNMPSISAIVNHPIDGEYEIVLTGFGLSDAYVNVMANHVVEGTNVVAGGLVDSLGTVRILFKYDFGNKDSTSVGKIVEDNTLRQDVDLCYKIDYITNQGIYNSLSKKVLNAEKKHQQGQNNAARNILNAFINEVEAQKGKKIDSYAADKILIYDAQKLIELWQ